MHSEEELRLILSEGAEVTGLSRMIALNAMDFKRKQARHVMVPRKEMAVLAATAPAQVNIEFMQKNKFSRYPVYKGTVDNITGIVHTKDIFKHNRHLEPTFTLEAVYRDAVFIPETAPLETVLDTMLQKKKHMIILVDEYGGTAGLITLENVLEEIVGSIQDEFDREAPEVVRVSEHEFIVDGSWTTNDVERLLELSVKDILSIGGFVVEQLGRIPRPGESFRVNDTEFIVEKVEHNVVETVRIRRLPPPPPEAEV
jgi:CBS domain containing-hemolysin-like protein